MKRRRAARWDGQDDDRNHEAGQHEHQNGCGEDLAERHFHASRILRGAILGAGGPSRLAGAPALRTE